MASIAFAVPLAPGKADEMRVFFIEAAVRGDELAESRLQKGITRDAGWIMSLPQEMGGDFLIVLLEGDDPVKGNQMFAESTSEYDTWFKARAGEITGVDFNRPMPPSDHVWEWHA